MQFNYLLLLLLRQQWTSLNRTSRETRLDRFFLLSILLGINHRFFCRTFPFGGNRFVSRLVESSIDLVSFVLRSPLPLSGERREKRKELFSRHQLDFSHRMTPEVDTTQADIAYLMEEIRTNLLVSPGSEQTSGSSRAQAWLLTILSFYGDQLNVLVDLYRLFRQENSYQLLSFVIEHLLQHQSKEIDHNRYLQEEFKLIFTASSNR